MTGARPQPPPGLGAPLHTTSLRQAEPAPAPPPGQAAAGPPAALRPLSEVKWGGEGGGARASVFPRSPQSATPPAVAEGRWGGRGAGRGLAPGSPALRGRRPAAPSRSPPGTRDPRSSPSPPPPPVPARRPRAARRRHAPRARPPHSAPPPARWPPAAKPRPRRPPPLAGAALRRPQLPSLLLLRRRAPPAGGKRKGVEPSVGPPLKGAAELPPYAGRRGGEKSRTPPSPPNPSPRSKARRRVLQLLFIDGELCSTSPGARRSAGGGRRLRAGGGGEGGSVWARGQTRLTHRRRCKGSTGRPSQGLGNQHPSSTPNPWNKKQNPLAARGLDSPWIWSAREDGGGGEGEVAASLEFRGLQQNR